MKALLIFTSMLIFIGCDSNRSIEHLKHPMTNESITLLILSGFSNDYTFVIEGEYKSTKTPKSNLFAAFHDSFGITFNDTSWVIFHLGDIVVDHKKEHMNIDFIKLDKIEYRHLIDSTETEFVHRYYF